jgi:hypothetical protein
MIRPSMSPLTNVLQRSYSLHCWLFVVYKARGELVGS